MPLLPSNKEKLMVDPDDFFAELEAEQAVAEQKRLLEEKEQAEREAEAKAEQARINAGREDARKEIDKLIKKAYEIIHEAESIADDYMLDIDFSLAYGMGGTYYPEDHPDLYGEDSGWQSSSSNC